MKTIVTAVYTILSLTSDVTGSHIVFFVVEVSRCCRVSELNCNAKTCGIWSQHFLCILLCKWTMWCQWTAINSKFYSHSWTLSEVEMCWTSKVVRIHWPCAN